MDTNILSKEGQASASKIVGYAKVEIDTPTKESIQPSRLVSKIEGHYMSKRIFSQKIKDTLKMNKLNCEYIAKSDYEKAEGASRMACKCKKFGKDSE